MKKFLPKTWNTCSLDDLIIFVLGGDWGKRADYEDPEYTEVRCIRASEVRDWDIDKGKTAARRRVKHSSLASRKLCENDILVEISGGGPEQPVGRTLLIDKSTLVCNADTPKVCTNFFRLMRPSAELSAKYLNSYLQYFYKMGNTKELQSGSNNLRNLKFSDYMSILVPIAPREEQDRIVAKIEELFSELDKGVESLKTAQEQLKVYRQAVLKHAFEGKLTAQWREENKEKLETADEILARIKEEREALYKQQLEQWDISAGLWEMEGKQGKKPSKPKYSGKLELPSHNEINDLVSLPSGWAWLKIGDLCNVVRGGSPRPAGDMRFYEGDIPFLKVADLTGSPGAYLDKSTYTIKEAGLQKTRRVAPNTLLISNSGATLGVPKICLIDTTFNDGIAAFLGLDKEALRYHYYFWLSKIADLRSINQGAAQPNLNTNLLKDVFIPICSSQEIEAIVDEVENAFSVCDQLLHEVEQTIFRYQALRQSILKHVFSGKLIKQDPNDEPASILLDRIKAEKEQGEKNGKITRKARKKRTAA